MYMIANIFSLDSGKKQLRIIKLIVQLYNNILNIGENCENIVFQSCITPFTYLEDPL